MLQSTRIPRLGAFFLYFSLLSPIAPTKQLTVQQEPVLGLPLLSLLLLIGSQSVTEATNSLLSPNTPPMQLTVQREPVLGLPLLSLLLLVGSQSVTEATNSLLSP